ncbi:MAG: glycine oxidase ThiO [Planctomycetes bacterium]|nr:glycine oxidase ThiO [Planctomycetota bacterium]
MLDCLIVGGGVIGLSLAWELARRGRRVRVIDRGEPGREASWAGAGILPPASSSHAVHPLDQLRALSYELQPRWSAMLREETGIDDGYRRTGGIYVARRPGETASLAAMAEFWREEGIAVERLSPESLAELEPALAAVRAAYLLPDEAQLRNPRRLKALIAACQSRGVEVTAGCEAESFDIAGAQVRGVRAGEVIEAGQVCICSGAWTRRLLDQLHLPSGIEPIRGQMVMFRTERPILQRIVNEGPRYLVPRDDGRLLAGSTVEEAGFDRRTTEEGIAGLIRFAIDLAPALADAEIERTWAGLRPGTFDGLPYLGRAPGLENVFIAAGHFRSGLHLSAATAVEMARLICSEPNQIDLSPFHIGRRRDFD